MRVYPVILSYNFCKNPAKGIKDKCRKDPGARKCCLFLLKRYTAVVYSKKVQPLTSGLSAALNPGAVENLNQSVELSGCSFAEFHTRASIGKVAACIIRLTCGGGMPFLLRPLRLRRLYCRAFHPSGLLPVPACRR